MDKKPGKQADLLTFDDAPMSPGDRLWGALGGLLLGAITVFLLTG